MNPAESLLPDPAETLEVSPQSVSAWVHRPENERPRLIDCREADEIEICHLPHHEWFPLGEFPQSVEELTRDPSRGLIVYCHHGMRSLRAAAFLRSKGFSTAFSMRGGIEEWSNLVDPTVPRY
jgi:adenylyltransferase/sulfurtransferase